MRTYAPDTTSDKKKKIEISMRIHFEVCTQLAYNIATTACLSIRSLLLCVWNSFLRTNQCTYGHHCMQKNQTIQRHQAMIYAHEQYLEFFIPAYRASTEQLAEYFEFLLPA